MADPVPTEVSYRLSCSVLHITGTRETRQDWDAAEPKTASNAELELWNEAERRGFVRLPNFRDSHDFEIKLSPDGRLLAASNSSEGLLGDLIEASIGIASFAAGIVGAIAAPGLTPLRQVADANVRTLGMPGPGTPPPATPSEAWSEENPDGDAQLLEDSVGALRKLSRRLVAVAGQAADTELPASVYRKLISIRLAIGEIERQVAAINARRDAWYSARYVTSEDHDFDLPTDSLFRIEIASLVVPETLDRATFQEGPDGARAVLGRLGVAVVEVRGAANDRANTADAEDQADLDQDSKFGQLPAGIWFRMPRSAMIALYVANGDDDSLTLHSVDSYWVVDRDSQLHSFPLENKGSLDASAVFSPEGTVQSLTMDAKGRLEVILEALKAAPKQASEGFGHAEKLVTSWDKLASARADREIKTLKARKKQLEAEVANRGLESDLANGETLKELKERLSRLKTERAIGKIERPTQPDPQVGHDAERVALSKRLDTELTIEKLRGALAAFHEDGTLPPGPNGGAPEETPRPTA